MVYFQGRAVKLSGSRSKIKLLYRLPVVDGSVPYVPSSQICQVENKYQQNIIPLIALSHIRGKMKINIPYMEHLGLILQDTQDSNFSTLLEFDGSPPQKTYRR